MKLCDLYCKIECLEIHVINSLCDEVFAWYKGKRDVVVDNYWGKAIGVRQVMSYFYVSGFRRWTGVEVLLRIF